MTILVEEEPARISRRPPRVQGNRSLGSLDVDRMESCLVCLGLDQWMAIEGDIVGNERSYGSRVLLLALALVCWATWKDAGRQTDQ